MARKRKIHIRTFLRNWAGLNGRTDRTPIHVVHGSYDAPHVEGEHAYHTTLSGKTIVRHPNAYGWRTWRHPSTRRVEVGENWLRLYGMWERLISCNAVHTV